MRKNDIYAILNYTEKIQYFAIYIELINKSDEIKNPD